MDTKKALAKTANAYKGEDGELDGMRGLSLRYGMGKNSLQNRIYELNGQTLPFNVARQMAIDTGTTYLAEVLAQDVGGVFVKLPDINCIDHEDLHDKLMELHADIGKLSKDFFSFTRDDEIDQKEKRNLTEQRDKVCQTLHEWLALSFSIYCRKPTRENNAGDHQHH